ncbi:MAG: cofactor-independent phosphoglycerate mutase [Butyricicoccus pullicaecorum]|nr:cofactor-independent phosphoglycerate mutase [Butyricicoccus pullicaecorum]
MKYVVVLGDGMADEPIDQLGGKTPLAYADTPMMDRLAQTGEVGLAKTIPDGMKPGSDTANLAVLGYDPEKYYSGRSPLEALSIGVPMQPTDIALRCNIVTLSEEPDIPYAERTIIDHSSDEISTEDAAVLMEAVREAFENETYKFYVGTSYRHCLIWDGGVVQDITPPHDILGKVIGSYLPADDKLREMMEKSYDILNNHPLNLARAAAGKRKANSCWFWGAGTKPALSSFTEKTGKTGAMISAVDLLKGIAVGAGMQVLHVEGATGGLTTNYEGKAAAAVKALLKDGNDFAYIHVEAPDEMGHQGSVENKVKAIEYLDGRVIRPLHEALSASGEDFRILIMPDHPTPIRLRTHTGEPVPYLLYDSTKSTGTGVLYNEAAAKTTGVYVEHGYTLIDKLLEL